MAKEGYCDEMIEVWKKETPLEIREEVWDTVRVDKLITE